MSIWALLEIKPTSEIKEIKRAYAAQLKKHNPEDFPEQFKQLRMAYEAALEYAKTGIVHEIPNDAQTYINPVDITDNKNLGQTEPSNFDDTETDIENEIQNSRKTSFKQFTAVNFKHYINQCWEVYKTDPLSVDKWNKLLADEIVDSLEYKPAISQSFLDIVKEALRGWGTLTLKPKIPIDVIHACNARFAWSVDEMKLQQTMEKQKFETFLYALGGRKLVSETEENKKYFWGWGFDDHKTIVATYSLTSKFSIYFWYLLSVVGFLYCLVQAFMFKGVLFSILYSIIALIFAVIAFKSNTYRKFLNHMLTPSSYGIFLTNSKGRTLYRWQHIKEITDDNNFFGNTLKILDTNDKIVFKIIKLKIGKSFSYFYNLKRHLVDDYTDYYSDVYGQKHLLPILFQGNNYLPIKHLFQKLQPGNWADRFFYSNVFSNAFPCRLLEEWAVKEPSSASAQLVFGARLLSLADQAKSFQQSELFQSRLLKAQDVFERCIELYPADPTPFAYLQKVALLKGDAIDVIWEYFHKAIDLDKENWHAHINMLDSLAKITTVSYEEMLNFARNVAHGAADGSNLPAIVFKAFIIYWQYQLNYPEKQDGYELHKDETILQETRTLYLKSLASEKHIETTTTIFARLIASAWFWISNNTEFLTKEFLVIDNIICPKHWNILYLDNIELLKARAVVAKLEFRRELSTWN